MKVSRYIFVFICITLNLQGMEDLDYSWVMIDEDEKSEASTVQLNEDVAPYSKDKSDFFKDENNNFIERINDKQEWKKTPEWEYLLSLADEKTELKGHTKAVTAVAYSSDGQMIATGSEDGSVIIWNAKTGELLQLFKSNCINYPINSIAFSPNGKKVVAGSNSKKALIWNVKTGKLLHQLSGHTDWVTAVAFSSNGKMVATGASSGDGTAIIWDAKKGDPIYQLKGHESTIAGVAFSPDNKNIVTGASSGDYPAIIWKVDSGEILHELKGYITRVESVAFSQDGKQVIAGSLDNRIVTWDSNTGDLLHQIKNCSDYVKSIAFSPKEHKIATGLVDGLVIVWNLATGKQLYQLQEHTKAVCALAFSPDARQLTTGSWDATAKLRTYVDIDTALNDVNLPQVNLLNYLAQQKITRFTQIPDYLQEGFESLPAPFKDIFSPEKELVALFERSEQEEESKAETEISIFLKEILRQRRQAINDKLAKEAKYRQKVTKQLNELF